MKKTKLGISTALLAALAYFTAAFGGYPATLIVCGYVLLFEVGKWLRKSALIALLLMVGSSALTAFISLFGSSTLSISSMFTPLKTGPVTLYTIAVFMLSIIPKIVLCILGIRALCHKEENISTNPEETMQ